MEFQLVNYKGIQKEKIIENNILLNAKQDDKLLFNCLVCGEASSKTISALIKRGNDYKNIDLNIKTIFMCQKHSYEEIMKEKYGVKNVFQKDYVINKIKESKNKIKKEKGDLFFNLKLINYLDVKCEICGNNFKVQKRSYKNNICKSCKEKISYKKKYSSIIIDRVKDFYELKDEYIKQRDNTKNKNIFYKFKCVKCGNEFKDHLHSNFPRCKICFPSNVSFFEKEIFEFVKSIYNEEIIENDRNILSGRELDIYLPELNLAIEYNGLYWHSELKGKDKNYHLNKTKECKEKGIKLIHIFEDEWINKKEIVKSIISSKINIYKGIIYARKTYVKEINNIEEEIFLNENHLQGYIPSKICYGLYYNDILVSLMSFGKSRFNKKYKYELLRFANKLNIKIIGGANKLFSYFEKNNNYESIISYSDKRYFDGIVYSIMGFVFVNNSDPNYFYLDNNYNKRESRNKYQKHKLKNLLEDFNPELTEWENMIINGYDRIWDCGNGVWVKES
jgi:hypothetical protein